MRKILISSIAILLLLGGTAFATPMYVDSYLHPLDKNSGQITLDRIGADPPFEIYGHDWITDLTAGTNTLRIWWDWSLGANGNSLGSQIGDVFLKNGYAVALRDHTVTEGDGIKAGQIFSVEGTRTSDYYFDPISGVVAPHPYNWYGDHEIVTAWGTPESYSANVIWYKWTPQSIGKYYTDVVFDSNSYDLVKDNPFIRITQTCGNDIHDIPEPGMLLLLGLGLVGVGLVKRRMK